MRVRVCYMRGLGMWYEGVLMRVRVGYKRGCVMRGC